jgi:MerR family transcriptional regulator, redox-sensitive transcriptional activator SoxR
MSSMNIGEIARRANLRTSAIRYYEEAGLLPEPIRINGRRRYDASVLETLRMIQMAQEMGFTIAEIRALLYSFPPETPPVDRWRMLSQRKLAEIEAFMQQARERKALLEQTLACACGSLEECVRAEGF